MMKRLERGFTAIELGATLAVISVLAIGAVTIANDMRAEGQSRDLADADLQIVKAVRANYVNTSTFADLDTEEAIVQGIVPDNLVTGADTAVNAFGGSLTISAATITNTNDAFEIANAGLNPEACMRAVNGSFRSAAIVDVGTTEVKGSADTTLDVGGASAACDNDSNTVTATYAKNG